MEMKIWENGVQQYLTSLEGFLKDILLKKVKAEMAASQITDPAMAIEALKTGTIVVHAKEKNFETDIFIAFDENWIPQLSIAMLGVEETDVNEISRDLIKEFSSQLLGNIQVAVSEAGVDLSLGEAELIKSGQIANAVSDHEYFMTQIDITGKFAIDGDEQPQLAMIIAIGVPAAEKIAALTAQAEPEIEPPVSDEFPDEGVMSGSDIDDLFGEGDLFGEMETAPAQPKAQAPKAKQPAQTQKTATKKQGPPIEGKPVDFDDFNPALSSTSNVEIRNLDILKDVELDISVELGRKSVPLGDILHYVRGSVIELDKLAGEPVEVYANGRRIAEGEVVVIDENFGVRITNLVSTRERLESLR